MDYALLEQAAESIRTTWPTAQPKCGLVLGSGWGDVVDGFQSLASIDYADIPGLGKTGVAGHHGRLVLAEAAGLQTLIFQGRRHWYEGEGWTPIALPIYLLRALGADVTVFTNAAGGIRHGMVPGDLMIIDDHINQMSANPLIGPHNDTWGTRFPDQSDVYDAALRAKLHHAAYRINQQVHHGIYLAASGPTYETPAEVRAYRTLGADAVGMSTVPEATLANAAGLRVAGISCITNLAAGISPSPLSHAEVTEATKAAMPRMKALVLAFWDELAEVLHG